MTDHPTQPVPRRHGHPEPTSDHLDVEFVGLNVPQFDLPLKDPMVVELLSVLARSRQSETVRSSRPKSATIAWSGHPWQNRVITRVTRSADFLSR